MRRGLLGIVVILVAAAPAYASQPPVLTVSGQTLHWGGTHIHYVVERNPGPAFVEGTGFAYTPPVDAGHTDSFRVRYRAFPKQWSNVVTISYPAEEVHEEEHKEEEKHEEPPSEHVVHAKPTGPPSPSSGWHVAYADAFAKAVAEDTTLETWERGQGCCGNSNEVAVNQKSQARVSAEGLELVCSLGTYTVGGITHGASCGGVRTDGHWEYADALVGEWAAEIVAKWPVCAGGADPGFWIYPSESTEIDFFEAWCWPAGSRTATDWAHAEAGIPVDVSQGRHEIYPVTTGLGFDPSLAFHRYTTVYAPEGNGKYDVGEYIDGILRWQIPGQSMTSTYDGLIITNGLRVNVQADVMTVHSFALYQDGAHAGQGVKGAGLAPGTAIVP